ncbi:MAG: efflux RND transporter periplasmic adaptor subunit [Planctomycetota bacterium]
MSIPLRPYGRFLPVLLLALACCGGGGGNRSDQGPQTPGDAASKAEPKSNRIDVPEGVRRSLGIAFANVERRHVRETLRVPAQIELLPTARRHYRAPLAGRIELHVAPLQRVAAGERLYSIDSQDWRAQQNELHKTHSAMRMAKTRTLATEQLAMACERHERSIQQAHQITGDYVRDLERTEQNVGGQAQKLAAARVDYARLGAELAEAAEKHTETQTLLIEYRNAAETLAEQFDLQLGTASLILGVDTATLRGADNGWRTHRLVEIRARAAGIVDGLAVTSGALVQTHDGVLDVLATNSVRARARVLQGDALRLRPGMAATIVPATAASDAGPRATGSLQLAPLGDASTRTLEIFVSPRTPAAEASGGGAAPPALLRAGSAVFVEIDLSAANAAGQAGDKTRPPPLAVPSRCVLRDGLERVFFRRDPRNQDKVIRVTADVGFDDGHWIEILSGIMDGDEIVSDGAFELVLASSGSTPKGGHFHADGTWHEDH